MERRSLLVDQQVSGHFVLEKSKFENWCPAVQRA
jgi:hypothetical protein